MIGVATARLLLGKRRIAGASGVAGGAVQGLAGLFEGLGSSRTSGHGLSGAARVSRRSFAAIGAFMAAATFAVAAATLID